MEIVKVILWTIYPYSIMAIIGMGLVWQYDLTKVAENKHGKSKASIILKNTIISLSFLCLITGIAVVFYSNMTNDTEQLISWSLSLLRFNPDINGIMNITILTQIHLLLVLTLLLVLSFTKYITYLFKPHHFFKLQLVKKFNKL